MFCVVLRWFMAYDITDVYCYVLCCGVWGLCGVASIWFVTCVVQCHLRRDLHYVCSCMNCV